MHRKLLALAAALGCAAALGGVSTAQAKTLDLLIAGDSYSSGVGAGNYRGGACLQSDGAYGFKYADLLRAKGLTVNVRNVACGGATVPNLDTQLRSVTPDTDLVVMTIGGNDVGFANIVVQCFTPLISDPARCQQAVNDGKRKIPSVQASALQRLEMLKARARPGVKVAVVSYPYLANPGNYVLRGLFNSVNAGKIARELGDMGDQAVINAGQQANASAGYDIVSFVPTKDLFIGHEPDQDPFRENPNRWVHEFTGLLGPVDFYHPTPRGYQAMAEALIRAGGPTGDFGAAQG